MRAFFLTIHSKLRSACLLGAIFATQAIAGFTSIYAFGDGVCTTTQNPPPAPASLYNGARYCDGPVWIETLSQQLGITYDETKNKSFFGHTSGELLTSTAAFVEPADAATSLFIVWSADADFVNFMTANNPPYVDETPWENLMDQAIQDLKTAVATLHEKGARLIMMPNAVDVTAVPEFNYIDGENANGPILNGPNRSFVQARVIEFNDLFSTALDELEADPELDGLVIIRPDTFTFFENVQTNPTAFGMTNPFPDNAAVEQGFSNPFVQGANFVFWDVFHPTAKFQSELANFVNPLIPIPDTVPPVLTLPGDLIKTATASNGAVVTFAVSAEDAVDGPLTATALPASGSVFPVGTTTVAVSAFDAAGNEANDSFKVTVVDMKNLLKNITITPAGAGFPAITGLIEGGPPDGEVVLQASTDLGITDSWRDLSTISLNAFGNQSFGPIQDPQGAGLKRDFFRIKLPISP